MTWFAHDVPSLAQTARLFDLFLSSHPLMPLYVAAVAIKVRWRAVYGVHGWCAAYSMHGWLPLPAPHTCSCR